MENLFINTLLTMACSFGFYAISRLFVVRKSYSFYIIWILIQSCMFFCYFLIKNQVHFLNSIVYEIFTPIFYLSPVFLYLFFMVISDSKKLSKQYSLALLPIITISIIKVVLLCLYYDKILDRIHLYQIHINSSSSDIAKIPFQMEKILFLCRNIMTIIYLQIIDKALKQNPDAHLYRSWDVIFKPFRLSIYFISAVLLAQIITHNIFQWVMSDYIFINSIISFAAVMYFWHLSLLLKDLENSNSIFKLRSAKPNIDPNIPQKSLLILRYIYLEQIYKDPTLTKEKVSIKLGSPNFDLGYIFGTTLPFSFSSYINHLRLLEYEKGFNSKFDKSSNVLNAGFNSLSSFYYWESRKDVNSKTINPILEWIDHQETSKIRLVEGFKS